MIKRNSCGKSLEAVRLARDMLGGEELGQLSCNVRLCVSLPW